MADEKISAMTEDASPGAGSYVPYVDPTEVADADKNKRIQIDDLRIHGTSGGTHPDLLNQSGNFVAALSHSSFKGGAENLPNLATYTSYAPFVCPFDMEVDAYAIDIYTSQAASNRKVCLFENDATDGQPSTVVANSDLTIVTTATGWVVTTLGTNVNLVGGQVYWVVWTADTNGTAARGFISAEGMRTHVGNVDTPDSHNNWAASAVRVSETGRYSSFPPPSDPLNGVTTIYELLIPATLFLRIA